MLAREIAEYRRSFSSSCRPYIGWFAPSILTATDGCPFLHTLRGLWSRSIDCLVKRKCQHTVTARRVKDDFTYTYTRPRLMISLAPVTGLLLTAATGVVSLRLPSMTSMPI